MATGVIAYGRVVAELYVDVGSGTVARVNQVLPFSRQDRELVRGGYLLIVPDGTRNILYIYTAPNQNVCACKQSIRDPSLTVQDKKTTPSLFTNYILASFLPVPEIDLASSPAWDGYSSRLRAGDARLVNVLKLSLAS